MKRTFLALLLSLFAVVGVSAQTKAPLAERDYKSVVLLYGQTEEGGMKMFCTATAYKVVTGKDGKVKTRFVSAAHCVQGNTDVEQKQNKYFITSDEAGTKTFIPATLVEAGDKKVGDDFSIFEVEGTQFSVMPLGDSSAITLGDRMIDVSSPLGLGKEYYEGYVSNTHVDRPPMDAGEVQWTNVLIVTIGGGPGSSGSSIVSVKQEAIVGFLVGSFGAGNVGFIVVPVDKFKTFEAAVDKGTYKKLTSKDEHAE